MQRLWLTLVAVAGVLAASPARGQEVRAPHFEVGGNVSGIVAFGFGDGPAVVGGGGPRVTINVTPRLAIDLLAEVIGPTESSGTTALYQTQLELPVRRSPDGKRTVSFTVGAAGTAGPDALLSIAYPGSTGRRSSTRDIERFRSARPQRSPSASRGKRWSVAMSRPASPCRRISVPSEASPCARPLACRSASEGIDDHSLPSLDPPRAPDGGVRNRGPAARCRRPGPGRAESFPTAPPYVWDTADELLIWMNNPVARGSLALEGSGTDAFIRIDRATANWLLRGPDLEPAAEGVQQ